MLVLHRLGLALVPLALVVAACSSGGGPGPTAIGAGPSAARGVSGGGGAIPCDKLAPSVTAVTGLSIASTDAKPDNCTFTMNAPGDSSSAGFGGVVDIRQERSGPADWDVIIKTLTGTDGLDVPGVGDRARMTKGGGLMYAVHNGKVWAVQQVLLTSGADLPGNATKLFQALFQVV